MLLKCVRLWSDREFIVDGDGFLLTEKEFTIADIRLYLENGRIRK